MSNREELVFVIDEGVMGVLTQGLGAYASMVWFFKDGLEFEIMLENDEFTLLGEGPIDDND